MVLGRGDPFFRPTRALRPLFLLDTILLQDVRRLFFIQSTYVRRYIHIYIYVNSRIPGLHSHSSKTIFIITR